MRVKQILLRVKTVEEMADDFKRVWKDAANGKTVPAATETICFDSTEDMQKFLSPERIRLIKTVHTQKPKSILELAKLLDRDRKNVTEDVKMLESVGLIERKVVRKALKGSKKKVELIVDYEKIQLDIAV
jgi:predicted transcriptional regulator